MVKGFDEFAEEFRNLRTKMKKSKNITPKLTASWTSQLAGSMERLSNRIDLLEEELQATKRKARAGGALGKAAKPRKKDKGFFGFLGGQ